jgi:predicted enzyme related to lactoylglutathione lyase
MTDTMIPSGTELSHFGFCKLVVDDLERSADFYRRVFGLADWKRVSHDNSATTGGPIDEITFRSTAAGGPSLTLIKLVDRAPPQSGEAIMGFLTSDLEALLDRAAAAGGSIATPLRDMPDHGVKVAFVKDPEGHLLEVVELEVVRR